MDSSLWQLLRFVAWAYLLLLMLRFLLQLARADYYNPISQWIVRTTDPLLRPLQRLIRPVGGFDLALLLLALAWQCAAMTALMVTRGLSMEQIPWLHLPLWGAVGMAYLVASIYLYGLLALVIASWVAPASRHPALILLNELLAPLIRPVQRYMPPLGMLDLSPIVLFFGLEVLRRLLYGTLAPAVGLPVLFVPGI